MNVEQKKTINKILREIGKSKKIALTNMDWLLKNMHPYFFITFGPEKNALFNLCANLHTLGENRQLVLRDTYEKLIVATVNRPGTLFKTLDSIKGKDIMYAEMIHSDKFLLDQDGELELQKFHFKIGKEEQEPSLFFRGKGLVLKKLQENYPEFQFREFDHIFKVFLKNNRDYVTLSPPLRVARAMWLYQSAIRQGGAFLDVEPTKNEKGQDETRLVFSVINPLFEGYLGELIEIFYRLNIATQRNYIVETEDNGQRITILSAYITTRDGKLIQKDMPIYSALESELYNTKLINIKDRTYYELVMDKVLTGPEGSLLSAITTFVHTNMAHSFPYRFDWEETQEAFFSHLRLTKELIDLFYKKFNPDSKKPVDKKDMEKEYDRLQSIIDEYNTGHASLDETRKIMFNAALLFIKYTLKTNFFVKFKKALSFRIDPHYMEYLPMEIKDNLPPDLPFRITFFYHRHGSGYHFGFSDIARGGFRTIIAKGKDDFVSAMETIFKEAMVLAHTQHLKNKDIYQGGSKLAVVMKAFDLKDDKNVTNRLYNLQRGIINAFLDIYVTHDGKPVDPLVVDYYGEDEPVEIGPDENMHDSMIEYMANRAIEREYILGSGIISSKEIGINHKEYGVTSLGVWKFVEQALKEQGIDPGADPFSVKITGGPYGDVAGNELRILLKNCPNVRITSITDISGALYDPTGINKEELNKLIHKKDIDSFPPDKLNEGAFLLYSREHKRDGLIDRFKKIVRDKKNVQEKWVSSDDFHAEFENLIFSHYTDVFLPCGGRPETINDDNWERLFDKDQNPTTKAIIEGANSFISPSAREKIQGKGIVILKDSSANKCGVICSSYEIIGGLLMNDKEFLNHKSAYVKDVLSILEKRAVDEAKVIFQRYNHPQNELLYTEISNEISYEINELTDQIFEYLIAHPESFSKAYYKKLLLVHLPDFVQKRKKFRDRVKNLPFKYRAAIVSTEIATRSIYSGGFDVPFEEKLKQFARRCCS
ncbi:MAG: NAD-glutamate dehydrogenase [Thermodesulfobacteriota bacterium]|nr:NAD-glutamate dehydrogenase [Thermodesulfobacteriota bacterium]